LDRALELEAILFDVDGTLADTEEAHRLAFNDAFREFGFDWQWDPALYKRLLKVGGGKQRLRRYLETDQPEIARRPDLDQRVAEVHLKKTELYGERLTSGAIPLRPGVSRLIGEAHDAGLRLAIATTTSRANVDALFAATLGEDVQGWFEAIGSGESVESMKPSPDIYLWVLERLGLPGGACLALEDSANGLQSAIGAGIPAVITPAPYTADDDFSAALAVVSNLGRPDKPFEVLKGDAGGKTFVDLALLRTWRGHLE